MVEDFKWWGAETIDDRVERCFEKKDYFNLAELFAQKVGAYLDSRNVPVLEDFDHKTVFTKIGLISDHGHINLKEVAYDFRARVYKTFPKEAFFIGREANFSTVWGQPNWVYHFAGVGLEDDSINSVFHVFSLEDTRHIGSAWGYPEPESTYPFAHNAPGLYFCEGANLSDSRKVLADEEYKKFERDAGKIAGPIVKEFGLTHLNPSDEIVEAFRITSFKKAFESVIDKYHLYCAGPRKI